MPPLKLAVVGSGPSAFYVASRLLQLLPPTHQRANDLRIHLYDRLWAPYGLVRYGVAPDHPDVKNCTHKFDAAAADPRVQFFGNINISHTSSPSPSLPHALPLALADLFPHYTHLLLSPGASFPRTLPVIPNALPALSLVHWYTRHPASAGLPPPLPPGTRHLTLIGLGNVVLDIARLLLTPPQALAHLDLPAHVLAELARTWDTLKHVAIVGRRGPREARWSPKELRELLGLTNAHIDPIDAGVLDEAQAAQDLTRQETRVLQLLRKGSTAASPTTAKSFSLNFWRTPLAYAGGRLTLEDTRTREKSGFDTDMVCASLGFRGEGAPWAGAGWFDDAAGTVRHEGARVLTPTGEIVRNVYTSGWAAHGARGVIAGTLLDAKAVAARIVSDHYGGAVGEGVEQVAAEAMEGVGRARVEVMPREVDTDSVPELVSRGVEEGRVPGWRDWLLADAEEKRRGEEHGKERERMDWEEARAYLETAT